MTIENISKWRGSIKDQAKCKWFNDGKVESGIFGLTSLEKIK